LFLHAGEIWSLAHAQRLSAAISLVGRIGYCLFRCEGFSGRPAHWLFFRLVFEVRPCLVLQGGVSAILYVFFPADFGGEGRALF